MRDKEIVEVGGGCREKEEERKGNKFTYHT